MMNVRLYRANAGCTKELHGEERRVRVLLTGGAGYIGSHTAAALIEQGHLPIVVDDLSNSSPLAIRRLEEITGTEVPFYELDVADRSGLDPVFRVHRPEAVIHFAGLKAVAESVADPLKYYRVNLATSIAVLEAMARHHVDRLVFSSSATVYEEPGELLREDAPSGLDLMNPYGRTKIIVEHIIRDAAIADASLRAVILRYFNPVGAHSSGRIGEDPVGPPSNLMPFIAQVAAGRRDHVRVFGDDYPTPDGTGVRDYIHIMDLSEAHVAALINAEPGVDVLNVGTGRGTSVLEAIRAFEEAVGTSIPYEITARRAGDSASATADPRRAQEVLGWRARRTLKEACADAWRWQRANPDGYHTEPRA